jgi:hypothetical protein
VLRCAGGYRSSEPRQAVCVCQVVVVGVEPPLRVDVLDHQLLLAHTPAGDELLQSVAGHEHWRNQGCVEPEDVRQRERGGSVDEPAGERAGRGIGGPLHADQPDVLLLRHEQPGDGVTDLDQPGGVGVTRRLGGDEHLAMRTSRRPPQHDAVAGQRCVDPDVEVRTPGGDGG